jgi:predicted thioesterase
LELKKAKLNIRFRKPIPIGTAVTISAVADNIERHFYKAKSQIVINNTVYAEAEGYFRK